MAQGTDGHGCAGLPWSWMCGVPNDKLMIYVFRKDIAYPSQLYQISSQLSLEDNSRGKNKKGDEQHLPFHCIHGTQPTI